MNYYNVLELPFDATQDEIRKAYFELAKRFHPDINSFDETKEKFIKINVLTKFLVMLKNAKNTIKYLRMIKTKRLILP